MRRRQAPERIPLCFSCVFSIHMLEYFYLYHISFLGMEEFFMQESGENYLETILILRQKKGYVRSIDVANELGYSKASVSLSLIHI